LLEMVTVTLDGMAKGGMRDHLGGGFARYSTDEAWLVPHFEKMLYDNAALARSYAEASVVTGRSDYAEVAREVLDYVLREMTSPDGAFYSATDADSEGEEGKFFVWTPAELAAVLPPADARAFAAYYDVTPGGNWEGKSILHTPRSLAAVAQELGTSPAELETTLGRAKDKLYAARRDRVPPLLDDKVLVAWNALMLGALAECGRILGEPRYVAAAARAADCLDATLVRPDGGLYRTARAGKAHLAAYLEDYAYLADALVDLYEASGAVRHLERARALARRMLADFHDPETGAFFATAHGHEALVVRLREAEDNALPSPNAVAARALARLGWHTGDASLGDVAQAAARAHGRAIEKQPRAFLATLNVVDLLLEGPTELVIAGEPADPRTAALRRELARHYLPNRILVTRAPAPEGGAAPDALAPRELVLGKDPVAGAPAVYVCRDFACRAPVTAPEGLAAALGETLASATERRPPALQSRRLAGRATPEGTARRATRFAPGFDAGAYRPLGTTGLVTSAFGFGCYRVDDGEPEHVAALEHALLGGVGLVDTSTNYTDGASERAVGDALRRLVAAGELTRDEIVVVSKIGYAQGQNLELAEARETAGRPYPEMVKYGDGCWHCIHPEFLAEQLDRSLERLGLETLDVCLLHNPEYFLSDAKKRGQPVDAALRARFYERVARAFAHFEREVAAGRIGWYGVSSNTIAQGEGDSESTDLARLLAAAVQAGGEDHHFRVLQLPVNLYESAGVLAPVVAGATVLAHARAAGLAVLANRPLNAIVGAGMQRLAAPAAPYRSGAPAFSEGRTRLGELEATFARELAPRVAPQPKVPPPAELFVWGRELAGADEAMESLEHCQELTERFIVPRTEHAFMLVDRAVAPEVREKWLAWRHAYAEALEGVLAALRDAASVRAIERGAELGALLARALPKERHDASLARKALWVLASTPGVSTVLLGMRAVPYVEDALAVMRWEPLAEPERAYEAFRAAR
ncbi:MAG: aldo/keto reductase, partial [Polyangiaceae bacterium]|nr:aldo/keto reductase [Polyangiaceae bacterium]